MKMASRKIFNYESVILDEMTLQIEGYLPNKYGPTSSKFVWAICRFCGRAMRVRKGFFNKAGSACHRECRLKEQSIKGSPFNDPKVQEKARKTNLERYGNEHASQNEKIAQKISEVRSSKANQDKIKKTNLKKYGVENPFQSEEIKEKIKEKHIETYGVDHPMKSEEVQEKTKQTIQRKYGVDNLMQSEEVKQKAVNTNLEKYGVENPMQNENIREKARETNVQRYNFPSPMQNEEIKQKAYKTNKERYGYEHILQNPEIMSATTEKFKKAVSTNESGNFNLSYALRNNDFWKKMKMGYSLHQLCEEFGLQENSLRSRLLNEEFADRYYALYTFSKTQMQKEVKDEIEKYGYKLVFNDRQTITPLELDIYIPSCKFAIEFNGNYWHSEAWLSSQEARHKHIYKTTKCREKDIVLFHIFEHQWINRKFQVLNFIKSALNTNNCKIAARKCEINYDNAHRFIEDNHIQGDSYHVLKYFNLVYENEIVASMTASRHHRQNSNKNTVVLSRLCFKDNITVQGGASKLFKYFMEWAKKKGYSEIISWSDNCWTTGNIYKVLGFRLDREYPPDYFYWDVKGHCYVSKQSQQKKKVGCPEGITEREWCMKRGLYRVWNCGRKKWIFKIL